MEGLGVQCAVRLVSDRRSGRPRPNAKFVDGPRDTVFCLLTTLDQRRVDPLDLEQWRFFVVSTSTLNEALPEAKTVGLSTLVTLKPREVRYAELANAVRDVGGVA